MLGTSSPHEITTMIYLYHMGKGVRNLGYEIYPAKFNIQIIRIQLAIIDNCFICSTGTTENVWKIYFSLNCQEPMRKISFRYSFTGFSFRVHQTFCRTVHVLFFFSQLLAACAVIKGLPKATSSGDPYRSISENTRVDRRFLHEVSVYLQILRGLQQGL